jgi:diaminopimelate decarboxylase
VAEEGLGLDVCTGGELAVALRAGFPMERVAFHGNNKSTDELARAVEHGVGRFVVDSFEEIDRLAALAADRSGGRRRAGARHGRRRGAHPRVHRHRARGPEVRLLPGSGGRREAVRRVLALPRCELVGLHSHIGSQIFDTAGFEVAAAPPRRPARRPVRDEHGSPCPSSTSAAAWASPTPPTDDPMTPGEMAELLRGIVERECAASGLPVPRLPSSPAGRSSGPRCHRLRGRHGQAGRGRWWATRTYVSVDGGMSDNIRTALYDADYTVRLASRVSEAEPVLSRVVGKHCESGDIVVRDEWLPGRPRAGGPARRRGDRRLLPLHGEQLQPRPPAARGRGARRAVHGRRPPRDRGRPAGASTRWLTA